MNPKVLLVTGSSRGIGAATAILAAKRGYAVCVNSDEASFVTGSFTDLCGGV